MEYQGHFEKLLAKVGHLSQDRKVSCFLTGLRDSIRTDVQANRPTTLTMTIGLARLFEASNSDQKKLTSQSSRPINQVKFQTCGQA